MKKSILLIVSAASLILASCNNSSKNSEKNTDVDSTKSQSTITAQSFNIDTTKLKSGDTFYQCEMNPEVLSDKPGSCPTCGMDLSEIKKQ